MRRGIGNRSLQVIYEDVRTLRGKGLLGSITYGGVSRTGTMQKLHYLSRKGAAVVAETEGIGLEQVKFPKSTNTLVKNDFLHRIATIDLMISFDHWINGTGHDKLFFEVYFDTVGSQRDKSEGALRSKTRLDLDRQHFIDPDGILAYQTDTATRLFVLEVANGQDSKRVVEQIARNLFASYKGLVGDKYLIPQTATLLVVFDRPELLKGTLQRVASDPQLRRFEGMDKYLFFNLQQSARDNRATNRVNVHGEEERIFG
jgi:hypothetical protein